MVRVLFHIAAAVSSALCVCVIVLWVRSFNVSDFYEVTQPGTVGRMLVSSAGDLEWSVARYFSDQRRDADSPRWVTMHTAVISSQATTKSLLGIRVGVLSVVNGEMWYVRLPHLWIALLLSTVPMFWCFDQYRLRRAIRRTRAGDCVACGYSLRGVLDNACPECGLKRQAERPHVAGSVKNAAAN